MSANLGAGETMSVASLLISGPAKSRWWQAATKVGAGEIVEVASMLMSGLKEGGHVKFPSDDRCTSYGPVSDSK